MRDNFFGFDCHDQTGITAATVKNTWIADIGVTANPPGICRVGGRLKRGA